MACLPKGRTLFHYGKEHYAFYLLRRAAKGGVSISALRKSPFAPLLEKPAVRAWLAAQGGGRIIPEDIPDLTWLPETEIYRLSLGVWGDDDWRWNQVSRRGCSLVLHLNHSNRQNERLKSALSTGEEHDPFATYYHPEAGGKNPTLAWARLDIDLDQGEALIEEIQSDRIREVTSMMQWLRRQPLSNTIRYCGTVFRREALERYWEREMKRHAAIWEEAMLTAALDFLHREIGVHRVFYHTYETGRAFKSIRSNPPRSLYTTLPRRFCFQPTREAPRMLKESGPWRRKASAFRDVPLFHLLDV